MKRTLDITNPEVMNEWVLRSIELFITPGYLDLLHEVYPFGYLTTQRMPDVKRRKIIMAHQSRNGDELLNLLQDLEKFSYKEPFWYLMKNQQEFLNDNPIQKERILTNLYNLNSEELVVLMESSPEFNRQSGPMFRNWSLQSFRTKNIDEFRDSKEGIFLLNATEQEETNFLTENYNLTLAKRPDLVVKVNNRVIIGEAKWIGGPGGSQGKQATEVLDFCQRQSGNVIRIGIVDGYPWTTITNSGKLTENETVVRIQESVFDLLSALLLAEYLEYWLNHG